MTALRGALVLGAVACGIGLALTSWDGLDLNVYHYGGLTLRTEPDALYGPTIGRPRDPGLPFTYPPFAAALFVPLSLVPHTLGYIALTLAGLTLAALVAADLAPRMRAALPTRLAGLAPWLTWASVLGVSVLTGPYRDTFSFGQINILLMAVCYLAVARLGLGFWTGVVIGLCGAVKLTPLALGVLPGARRRWDCVAGIAAGFAGATGLTWAFLPGLSHRYWFDVLSDPSRIGNLDYIDNVSLRGALARFGVTGGALWAAASALVVAVVWVYLARRCRSVGDVEALGLAATPMLLISPVTWSHHWVWLAPLALSLLAVRAGRVVWGSFAVLALYLTVSPRRVLQGCGLNADGAVPAVLTHLSDLPAAWVLLLTVALAARLVRRHGDERGSETCAVPRSGSTASADPGGHATAGGSPAPGATSSEAT